VRVAVLLAFALIGSGLHGIVTRGPTQPVCRVGKPCAAPLKGALLLFSHGGRVVARVRSGTGGRYSVRLAPGRYAVRISPAPRIGAGLSPRSVRVARGVFRRLDFEIDTGIR
jgi:hypothetical protein